MERRSSFDLDSSHYQHTRDSFWYHTQYNYKHNSCIFYHINSICSKLINLSTIYQNNFYKSIVQSFRNGCLLWYMPQCPYIHLFMYLFPVTKIYFLKIFFLFWNIRVRISWKPRNNNSWVLMLNGVFKMLKSSTTQYCRESLLLI